MSSRDWFDMLGDLGEGFELVFTTTYDFDVPFFENYVLRHVEPFASADRVCVLVDSRRATKAFRDVQKTTVNRHYLLHPFSRAPHAFHPKVTLAVSDVSVVAVVGSANLTHAGWTRNLELVERFEATPDAADPSGVVRACVAYFEDLVREAPSTALQKLFRQAVGITPWLRAQPDGGGHLLTSRSGSLLAQVTERIDAAGEVVERIDVLSPSFDAHPVVFDALVSAFAPSAIRLFTDGGHGIPQDMDRWAKKSGVRLECFRVASEEDRRSLHAKALVFATRSAEWLVSGSANATSAALARPDGNEEVVLVRKTKRGKKPLMDALLAGAATADRVEAADLGVATHDDEADDGATYGLHLVEAVFEAPSSISLRVVGRVLGGALLSLRAGNERARAPLGHNGDEHHAGPFERLDDLLADAIRAQIVDGSGAALSNEVFVQALVEREHDVNAQVKRALKCIEVSPEAFATELDRIAALGDVEALADFFWFASLPGGASGRVYSPRTSTPPVDAPRARVDFRGQITLNAALERFWRRHLIRLRRTVEDPTPEEIPLALNLIAALHRALELQADMLLDQLMARPVHRNYEWSDARALMDRILLRYEELSVVLADLPNSVRDSEKRQALLQALWVGREDLMAPRQKMFAWKNAVDTVVRGLRVAAEHHQPAPAQYFSGNLALRWVAFADEVANRLISVEALVA